MNYSLIQGLTSGGAAAFLHSKLKKEGQESSERAWLTMAFQINHLLLLSAENLVLAGSPLGVFGSIVRTAPLLTLAATGISIYKKNQPIPFSPDHLDQFNNLYQAGVVAASIATFALASPVFAIASISMIGIDTIAKGKAKEFFDGIKKITAAFAALGYGMQIFSSEHFLALSGKISSLVVSGKLIFDELNSKNIPEPNKTNSSTVNNNFFKEPKNLTKLPPKKLEPKFNLPPLSDNPATSKENILCRKSVW